MDTKKKKPGTIMQVKQLENSLIDRMPRINQLSMDNSLPGKLEPQTTQIKSLNAIVISNHDKDYDYMKVGDSWSFRKKGASSWKALNKAGIDVMEQYVTGNKSQSNSTPAATSQNQTVQKTVSKLVNPKQTTFIVPGTGEHFGYLTPNALTDKEAAKTKANLNVMDKYNDWNQTNDVYNSMKTPAPGVKFDTKKPKLTEQQLETLYLYDIMPKTIYTNGDKEQDAYNKRIANLKSMATKEDMAKISNWKKTGYLTKR